MEGEKRDGNKEWEVRKVKKKAIMNSACALVKENVEKR